MKPEACAFAYRLQAAVRLASLSVIACDKRKAFAQGSECDEAIQCGGQRLDCFAGARNDGYPGLHTAFSAVHS